MSYYFIDFENVRTDGIKNLPTLKDGDVVAIFYSEQCKNTTLDAIEFLLKAHISIRCFKVKLGTKNALDFQLSSYLGYLIGQEHTNENFYIVSNDKGYDCLCDFWKEQGKSIARLSGAEPEKNSDINTSPPKTRSKKNSKIPARDLATLNEIMKYLQEPDSPEEVLIIFNQYKTKQAICNAMAKKFKDTKRASAIYKKLKPLLKEKNKS